MTESPKSPADVLKAALAAKRAAAAKTAGPRGGERHSAGPGAAYLASRSKPALRK